MLGDLLIELCQVIVTRSYLIIFTDPEGLGIAVYALGKMKVLSEQFKPH